MNLAPLQAFNRRYVGDYPFLSRQSEEWAQGRPLAGLTVLHNLAITCETLQKLEPLLLAGAEVTVTHLALPGLAPRQDCIAVLREAGVPVEVDHARLAGRFDFALDCCAQIPAMAGVEIARGYVELTQSGTGLYRALQTDLPVYSVDDSKLKCLEGMYGTGEACVRALQQFVTAELSGRRFLLFGYGKVGRGIAKHLVREGALLTICEIDAKARALAERHGHDALDPRQPAELHAALADCYGVITATGSEGFFAQLCPPDRVPVSVRLINMGADDEFGPAYPADRVIGDKAPINFLLDAPTAMFFIDPIFAAHNRCCLDILEARDKGFTPLPADMDLPWVEEWSRRYGIDTADIHE